MAQANHPTYTELHALIPELRTAARALVDGSAASPDDLVQDALVVALRGLGHLPAGRELKPWLLGVLSDRARMAGEHGLVERAERAEELGATPAERG